MALVVCAMGSIDAMWSVDRAQAQGAEVVGLFEQGLAAYRDGRYEEAAALFARAHDIEAVPDLTYNRARALENLGRAREAAEAYALFLRESPTAADRNGIEARIRVLEARADEEARAAEERARLAAMADPAPPPVAPPPAFDAWPWVVFGGGLAIAGGGGVIAAIAQVTYDDAARRDVAQEASVAAEAQAQALAISSFVVLGVGGVAAVIGLVWGLASGNRSSETPRASLGPGTLRIAF